MSLILVREIAALQTQVVRLALVVEARLEDALASFAARDVAKAQEVVDNDDQIDRREVEIEEECLKILALHQPVATDLRWVIAILKINNDLERVADIAVNIADRVRYLATTPPSGLELHLQQMGDHTISMLRSVFDGMTRSDPEAARAVIDMDEKQDQMHHQTFDAVEHGVAGDTTEIRALLLFLSVSRDLERVGDHATNIAEDLLYLFSGAIVRHAHKHQEPKS